MPVKLTADKKTIEREMPAAGSSLAVAAVRENTDVVRGLLAAIVESSEDAIISKDLNGVITSWNRGAERVFGYTAEETIGQPVTMLMPPDRFNEEPEILHRIRSGQRIEHYETVRRRKDGRLLDISLTISPVYDERGYIVGASKVARDISDQKRIQAALVKTQGLAAAGRAAASIAHEINNPLESVTNLLYLLRSHVTDAEGIRNLEMAETELARVARITKKTLAFYHDTSTPSPLDLSELITETVSMYSKKMVDKRVTVVRSGEPCTVYGLYGELQQLFSNLIGNAVDAVDEGGRIEIDLVKSGNTAVVTIADNGHGILPGDLTRVFEPFYTTKKDLGTGLGLWIAKEIAQKHGAVITVESSVDAANHGATFVVTFPKRKPDLG